MNTGLGTMSSSYSTLEETTPLSTSSDGMAGFDALDASNTATTTVPAFFDAGGEQPTTANFEANKREAKRSSPRARKTERCACGTVLGISMAANAVALAVAIAYVSLTASQGQSGGSSSSQTGGSGSAGEFNGTCPFGDTFVLGAPNITAASVGAQTISICWTAHKHNMRVNSHAYELQSDDWFSNDTSLSPIYIGNFRGVTLTNLLPATEYRLRIVAHSGDLYAIDGSGPHRSEVVVVRTADALACGNANDLQMQRMHFATMKSTIQTCLITALFNEDRAQACITEALDFSPACAFCWVDEGKCAAAQCAVPCIQDPAGEECDECAREKCFGPLEDCSGIPSWSYPA